MKFGQEAAHLHLELGLDQDQNVLSVFTEGHRKGEAGWSPDPPCVLTFRVRHLHSFKEEGHLEQIPQACVENQNILPQAELCKQSWKSAPKTPL